MRPRFTIGPELVLEHADSIDIKLSKIGDSYAIQFEVKGDIWPTRSDTDDGEDGELQQDEQKVDPRDLAKQLLAAFIFAKGGVS